MTGTKLMIEPAPYSQLAFTSTPTEGSINWIFYQGRDKKIVECHYRRNMVFCQDGSGDADRRQLGQGVLRPLLARVGLP